MKELRERNQQVLQMLQAGASCRETVQRFGVATQRVEGIVQEFEVEKAFLQRSWRLLEEIRRTDDVESTERDRIRGRNLLSLGLNGRHQLNQFP